MVTIRAVRAHVRDICQGNQSTDRPASKVDVASAVSAQDGPVVLSRITSQLRRWTSAAVQRCTQNRQPVCHGVIFARSIRPAKSVRCAGNNAQGGRAWVPGRVVATTVLDGIQVWS